MSAVTQARSIRLSLECRLIETKKLYILEKTELSEGLRDFRSISAVLIQSNLFVSSMKGERNGHFDRLDLGAPNGGRKSASLLSSKLKVAAVHSSEIRVACFSTAGPGSSMPRGNGNRRNSKTRSAAARRDPQPFHKEKGAPLEATNL